MRKNLTILIYKVQTMSEQNNAELDNDNFLDLSDEELLNMAPPTFEPDPIEDDEEELEENTYEEEEVEETDEEEEDFDEEVEPTSNQNVFDNSNEYEDNEPEQVEKPSQKEESSKEEVDYKAAYDQIFKPFKANGKEIQVKNADEAIQLMQMGANYNKKMAGIKQQLPILKMLEKNNLLDETKLSYAIDLLSGDKAAIARLVKETEVDLYDIDEESGDAYVPSYKGVSDVEMALTNTIEEIRDTPDYERTIDIATNVWDTPSQQFIVNNPDVLKVINQHISAGIFDTVWEEVERLQALGNLPQHLNSLEAYKVVGDNMNAQGLLGGGSPEQQDSTQDSKREAAKRKKQATQKPKSAGRKQNNNNAINPLELSDEEFEKLGAKHLM